MVFFNVALRTEPGVGRESRVMGHEFFSNDP